ncbi:BglG family transcription antiterminator LicT [Metabacillus arenae]|uniref:PRD domain-containing protein n=1 Tax=Metabacillus arenae TaxID=2771434 RepID=A0A926RXZ1_9BACI|nr:PRD domain-containing protein [Metabacillus arenae]MBD1381481.1 PRD domain-containing protein [Metabacillus arenae]
MEIIKVFNNNVVLTENEHKQEMVVMGRGLAFQRRVGDAIDNEKVEKTFVLENQGISDKLAELLEEISEKYLLISERIITYAKSRLGASLDDYLYVALTDHLSFAISRHKQGLQLPNALTWEIKKYYKNEYHVALKALDMIEEETGIRMDDSEAASIALHLVNSQMSGDRKDEAVQVVKMVNDILSIVKYHYKMELDESSISYERFLTHLRFFAWRLIRKERTSLNNEDDFLFQQIKRQYHKAFICSEKIAAYVENTHKCAVSIDELSYLTLHIHRVTSRYEWNQNTPL